MGRVHVRARQIYQALGLGPLGMLVDVHVAVLALLLQHKILLLPLVRLVLLFGEEALHFYPLLLLGVGLFAALAQRRVNLLGRRLFRLFLPRGKRAVVFTALLLHVLTQRVALHNLLRLVAVNDRVQAFERSAAHHVAHALLFNTEALYLVVYVKEERVVAGRIIAGPDQETPGPGPHQQVHRFRLTEIPMEPGEHGVGVDRLVQVRQQVLEYQALFAGPMGRHPEPAVAEVVVNEEDVAGLEGDLVRIGHLGVGQNRHHALLVVDGLGGRDRVLQPLMLQQVRDVGVVA